MIPGNLQLEFREALDSGDNERRAEILGRLGDGLDPVEQIAAAVIEALDAFEATYNPSRREYGRGFHECLAERFAARGVDSRLTWAFYLMGHWQGHCEDWANAILSGRLDILPQPRTNGLAAPPSFAAMAEVIRKNSDALPDPPPLIRGGPTIEDELEAESKELDMRAAAGITPATMPTPLADNFERGEKKP